MITHYHMNVALAQHWLTSCLCISGCVFPGSPFKVPVEDVVDPSKVRVYGPGVNPEGVRASQAAPFTVDCKNAGKAPLKATVDDGKYCYIKYDFLLSRRSSQIVRYGRVTRRNMSATLL